MQQEDNKEQFIEDYMRSRVVSKTSIYGLFKKVENYERHINKNAYNFTKEEILEMYRSFKSRSEMTLINNNTILKAYGEWNRYFNNANIVNNYNDITIFDVRECVDKNASKIMSKEDVIDIEDNLLNYTDAAIVHAIFCGISGPSMRDLTSLNEHMLNENGNTIHFEDGRIIEIDDRLVALLKKAFDEEHYNTYGETMIVKKLAGRGKLFKERDNCLGSLDTDDKKFRACYRKIQVMREYLGIKELTMKGIAAAGFLHNLKTGMSETKMGLKEYLLTDDGSQLMDRYGYQSKFRVDNVIQKYKRYL